MTIPQKVVVIGSGFGGLAVAIRLQAAGFAVTLVEKREKVGGRAYQITDRGYTFDMGPSLITVPGLFDELFVLAGKKREDYVEFVPLDPFYRIYFDQGAGHFEKVDYNGDPEHMKAELERLEPGSGERYDAFFAHLAPIYETAYKKFGAKSFLHFWDFLSILPDMFKLGALRSVTSIVGEYFHSNAAFQMYSFHPLFLGTNPYHAPGALAFIPYLERAEGVWFAKGGMYSVVSALAKLFEEKGGTLITGVEVTALHNSPHTRQIDLVMLADGRELESDLVVSNGDVVRTYELIKSKNRTVTRRIATLQKSRYSMSLFLLYLGLSRQYHYQLAHHTLVLGVAYKKLLEEIFEKLELPSSLSLYLHIPTITDSSMAPEGCESMYILVPMPNLLGGLSWTLEIEQRIRDWVVRYLEEEVGLTGFADAIEVEHHFTPQDFETDLNSYGGAAFATEVSLLQSVYFRQHNKAREFDNLYFVGGGTHPGPGVPGVLKSAECTATLILT